jgi:putative drug exporter of the RND superfamily
MLSALARFVVRRRKAVLVASLAFFILAGALGGSVAESLTSGGFDDPASESFHAQELLEREFGTREPQLVLLLTARGDASVDDPAVAAAGTALTERVARESGIEQAQSYWTLGNAPPLRGDEGRQAMVLVAVRGDDDEVRDTAKRISADYTGTDGPFTIGVGGRAEVFRQVGTQIEKDLTKAESIALPITLILLILVFGSVVAAGLPLGVGAISVVGTFLVLRVLASITDVSIFALNLTTALGLGLAIDYSLFIVSRYREETARGLEPHDAVIRTVETAGKTVAFSALTVAVSLAALLVFPLAFLRSFAYAGVAVALIAAVGAVFTLPALLAVLGRNVDRWVLWRRTPKPVGEGLWHRIATTVMRRPLPIALGVTAILLLLGAPFLRVVFALPDERVLPPEATARQVQTEIKRNFSSNETTTLSVVAPDVPDAAARDAETDAYAIALSRIDGVSRVDARTGSYVDGTLVFPPGTASQRFVADDATWLSVVPSVLAQSPAGEHLVHEVRDVRAPYPVVVGGQSAQLVDSKASLFGRMPLALGLIAISTFVLLFMMFGSILVPIKALVINVLSLTATFGAMVWIFQEGNFAGFLNFTPTGTLDTTTPILMFCIAFGLSMDYEVFLLSRIKEEHDRSGDNTAAVALGLERTGRIVTAAALLISVVFLAFATSSITFIKLFGLGLALAVLMDAFVIRATLVPAFMRLAGEANWWAPGPMRRFHERFGISEGDGPEVVLDPPGGAPDAAEPEPAGMR